MVTEQSWVKTPALREPPAPSHELRWSWFTRGWGGGAGRAVSHGQPGRAASGSGTQRQGGGDG